MKTVQKFSTFSSLKKEREITGKPICADEIKNLLKLLREGEISVDSKINQNAK